MLRPGIFGIRSGFVMIMRSALCVLVCTALLCLSACRKEQQATTHRAPVVEIVEVVQKDVPIVHEWVGAADGLVNATIRAQVTGYLISQDYNEGELVQKGQVLFEIDPRPFQAVLDQAQGTLAQMEALYEDAHANLVRDKPLFDQGVLAKKKPGCYRRLPQIRLGASACGQGRCGEGPARPRLHENHFPYRWCGRHCQGAGR